MALRKVSDQPSSVARSVDEFVEVLTEAVAIVLLVSFFSLGFRTGLVVALAIPLVLAMTFATMHYFGVGLHKISLGALVLALGLLVDDAIIAVEMMVVKMEQGFDRVSAAAAAWDLTAFPMLTGTLVTAAGFLPIATAASSTGDTPFDLPGRTNHRLAAAWIARWVFIPYLGDKLLPDYGHARQAPAPRSLAGRALALQTWLAGKLPGALRAWAMPKDHSHDQAHDPYQTRFYQRFRGVVDTCVRYRKTVIAITVAAFVVSILMFRFVPQQFFPDSTRLELMVDLEQAEGSSLESSATQVKRLEALLAKRKGVDNYVAYVGTGSPRFYLPLDQQLPAPNFSQFVLLTRDIESRESIRRWLIDTVAPQFPMLQMRVTRLENGPPVGYPIQFRVSGEHIPEVQRLAREVMAKVRAHPHVRNVNLDWSEPSKVVRLKIDQDRARALGVSSGALAQFLQGSLAGSSVSQYREATSDRDPAARPSEEASGCPCSARWQCRPPTGRVCRCRSWRPWSTHSKTASSGIAIACRR